MRANSLKNSPSYNTINRNRINSNNENNLFVGGGIAIGVHKSFVFQDLQKLIPENLQDLEIIFIKIAHPLFQIHLINVYF